MKMSALISTARVRALYLFISLPILSGCWWSRSIPLPDLHGISIEGPEKDRVLAELLKRDSEVTSFRGLSYSTLNIADSKHLVRHIVIFQKSENLRLETLPRQGAFPLQLLVVHAGQIVLLSPPEKRGYQGEFRRKIVQKVIGFPASAYELMTFLTGTLPRSALLNSNDTELYYDADSESFQLVVGDFEKYVQLDAKDLTPQRIEVRDQFDGSFLLALNYSDYRLVNSLLLPGKIVIDVPQEGIQATLRFSILSINKPVEQELFELQLPGDYREF